MNLLTMRIPGVCALLLVCLICALGLMIIDILHDCYNKQNNADHFSTLLFYDNVKSFGSAVSAKHHEAHFMSYKPSLGLCFY
jgi:hypothetical protein